jgi:uncharacterized protein (DUF58 family)
MLLLLLLLTPNPLLLGLNLLLMIVLLLLLLLLLWRWLPSRGLHQPRQLPVPPAAADAAACHLCHSRSLAHSLQQ